MGQKRGKKNKPHVRSLSRRKFIKYSGLSIVGASTGIGIVKARTGRQSGNAFPNGTDSKSTLWRKLKGIDKHGALIGAAIIDPILSYAGSYNIDGQIPAPVVVEGVADLLAQYIQSDYSGFPSEDIWHEIEQRIDYTYECLDPVLKSILGGRIEQADGSSRIVLTPSGKKVQRETGRYGKKLFFKPNVVTPEVMGYDGSGKTPLNQYGCPGQGVQACTDWSFLAALMRWFHDNLDISYYQMAVGDGSPMTGMARELLNASFPFDYTSESVYEGRVSSFDDPNGGPGSPIYYGGYPFYFVRKYLSSKHDPTHYDDPMQGHMESQLGVYVPPGAATQLLPIYDLNNAEAHSSDARGRVIPIPHGAQYQEATVHKAIVGDPNDPVNYPGCVLINVPKLKVHGITSTTNAIKNLGIGLWPCDSGYDSDPSTPDFKYSLPSTVSYPGCDFPPHGAFKMGIYHSPHSHGLQHNCDGSVDPASVPSTSNDGIKGTMLDIDCAIIGRHGLVSYALHVCDAVTVTNGTSGGTPNGFSKNEGLLLASEDPVALDLFATRYLFKGVPRDQVPGHPFAMYTPYGDIRFDDVSNAIVSSSGVYEFPIENNPLFAYAEERKLGKQRYHVVGLDLTSPQLLNTLLVSQKGHFGRLVFEGEVDHRRPYQFEEIITQPQQGAGLLPYYASMDSPMCVLQNTLRKLAIAEDEFTQSFIGINPGYQSRFDAADADQDGHLTIGDDANEMDALLGILAIAYSYLSDGQPERCEFHSALKLVKYSEPMWNSQMAGNKTDSTPMVMAFNLASLPLSASTVDQFFGNAPYGLGADGMMRWPSLQWSRYLYELNGLQTGYATAAGYAAKMGYTFNLKIPDSLPYFPFVPNPFLALGLPEIQETTQKDEMFVATFYNQAGEEVERW